MIDSIFGLMGSPCAFKLSHDWKLRLLVSFSNHQDRRCVATAHALTHFRGARCGFQLLCRGVGFVHNVILFL